MRICRQVQLISTIALVTIGCERPPNETGGSSSPAVAPTAKSQPAALDTTGGFAYVDSSGTQMLALDSLPDPSTVTGALCPGGTALRVRYDRKQARRPNDNGRQVAYNFGNQQGDVFRVLQDPAPPDGTCYLSPDSALLASASAVTTREPSNCSPLQSSRLAAAKKREVIHCWHIATAPAQLEVLAVQFATIDSSALASLVVVSDSSLFFKDFPAIHNADEGSTWRVDDEGVFSPGAFDILFVASMPYGYVMAFTWAGAEGQSSELLLADSAGVFRTLTIGFRYWSPV
jgi:hypothetical protein